ncbi:MAG: MoaD/ThiS family protein [Propionibacteriaceae bacterium]|nr:MoaD/ThiS family protein [Propionibacteriaceae bacterium]
MAHVRYFAAAAEAAGVASESIEADTLGELREAAVANHGSGFALVLDRCSVLVDGANTQDPDTPLAQATLVDILPPFAGG